MQTHRCVRGVPERLTPHDVTHCAAVAVPLLPSLAAGVVTAQVRPIGRPVETCNPVRGAAHVGFARFVPVVAELVADRNAVERRWESALPVDHVRAAPVEALDGDHKLFTALRQSSAAIPVEVVDACDRRRGKLLREVSGATAFGLKLVAGGVFRALGTRELLVVGAFQTLVVRA